VVGLSVGRRRTSRLAPPADSRPDDSVRTSGVSPRATASATSRSSRSGSFPPPRRARGFGRGATSNQRFAPPSRDVATTASPSSPGQPPTATVRFAARGMRPLGRRPPAGSGVHGSTGRRTSRPLPGCGRICPRCRELRDRVSGQGPGGWGWGGMDPGRPGGSVSPGTNRMQPAGCGCPGYSGPRDTKRCPPCLTRVRQAGIGDRGVETGPYSPKPRTRATSW
jgi:hypothetical protein